MNSIYHILDKHPAIYPEDIQIEYENLAQELVKSGRLRIDTDYYCNFIHYNNPQEGINAVFSYDELTKPELLKATRQRLRHLYDLQHRPISEEKLNFKINQLKNQTKTLLLVSDDLAIKLARIFVQAAHPIVIRWMLWDKVEVFITYSSNIGDVMNIQNWKRAGTNSGMQSTDGSNVCIYVSCGGDPFSKNNEKSPKYGDGWAAAARLQVIAGQEIGHYADIKRDYRGNQITRHSANFSCTRAVPHVKQGRRNDIARCSKLLDKLLNNGMKELIELEAKLRFYDQNTLSGPKVWWIKFIIYQHRRNLLNFTQNHKLHFVKRFRNEKYMGLMIAAMIEDMQSHLSPMADVYKRSDAEAEEAISCVEALARVPQQVMKWGYLTTRATMHDLYKVYYSEVIPSLIDNYNHLTNSDYKRNYSVPKKDIFKTVLTKLIKIIGRKDDNFKFTEVRDI